MGLLAQDFVGEYQALKMVEFFGNVNSGKISFMTNKPGTVMQSLI
jgi:hypothetical protein